MLGGANLSSFFGMMGRAKVMTVRNVCVMPDGSHGSWKWQERSVSRFKANL
ncbi:MAG: hypothetical protein ACLPSH_18515 [Vulcanimicrobiaceae bacterium]